ncbi:hypothetical protein HDU98_005295 [Podochytrium sp. JEL0797]|nr:hypothetical protein HDU98_005295 [Podochytrium sp. JEL0797]
MDWSATFLGDLIIAPLFLSVPSFNSLDISRLALLSPIAASCASIGIAFALQYAAPNNASLLVAFVQFPFVGAGTYWGGFAGSSLTCACAVLANLGFSFISDMLGTFPVVVSYSVGPVPVLFVYSMIQIGALCLLLSLYEQQQQQQQKISSKPLLPPTRISGKEPPSRMVDSSESNSLDMAQANKAKFLSLQFVQIHGPLVSILEACSKMDFETSKQCSSIRDNAAIVLAGVDDILNYERLEAELVTPQRAIINLQDAVDLVMTCAQKVFDKHGILFEYHSNIVAEWVFVDVAMMQQAILNLLLGPLDVSCCYVV